MVGYPMALANGAAFAGYTIVRLQGSGGLGEVYPAEHPQLPRRDGVKTAKRPLEQQAVWKRQFLQFCTLVPLLTLPSLTSWGSQPNKGGS